MASLQWKQEPLSVAHSTSSNNNSSPAADDDLSPQTNAVESIDQLLPPAIEHEYFQSNQTIPVRPLGVPFSVDLRTVNVVCNLNLRCHINLRDLAVRGHNVIHSGNSTKAEMKLKKPPISACVWSSGKLLCFGAKTELDCVSGARRVARQIQKLGYACRFDNFRINNTLTFSVLPFGLQLDRFANDYSPSVIYEPELNPDAVYRPSGWNGTIRAYATGTVATIAPRVRDCLSLLEHFIPIAMQYQRKVAGRNNASSSSSRHAMPLLPAIDDSRALESALMASISREVGEPGLELESLNINDVGEGLTIAL